MLWCLKKIVLLIFVWIPWQGTTLRDEYHNFLTKTRDAVKKKHPSWSGKEIMAKVREMFGAYVVSVPCIRVAT